MMTTTLTDAQLDETIAAIRRLSHEHGYPPSLEEVGAVLGLGKNATHNRLVRLRDLGRVVWVPGLARTLRIIYPDPSLTPEQIGEML